MHYKILDTNILLLDAYNLITLGRDGSIIVLPETVLDELDSKKSLLNELGYQAREVGRLLTRATKVSTNKTDGLAITKLQLNDTNIEVVSADNYNIELTIDSKIINDRKIIYIAQQYTKLMADQDVTFISNDVMCRLRADSMQIKVADLKQIEDTDIVFTRTLEVDEETFRTLHHSNIRDIDPKYKPNYFNYIITNPSTGQVKLGVVASNKLQVIGRDTETDLRKQDINPANAEQLFFSKALQDPDISINICEAKAGSGKTMAAISNGIRNVRKGLYNQLIYIRASVDDVDRAEEIGFLAGNDEKKAVYLHPLDDTLDYIIRKRYKGSKLKSSVLEEKIEEEITELKEQCNIQSMIGLGMRGRTFHNAYVIIDEAQNQSQASLQKMLTRFGTNCKIVVIGSNNQIDNSYITKYTNGLSVLLDACTKEQSKVNLHAVSLPKVLRGPIAEFAENLFSKSNQ